MKRMVILLALFFCMEFLFCGEATFEKNVMKDFGLSGNANKTDNDCTNTYIGDEKSVLSPTPLLIPSPTVAGGNSAVSEGEDVPQSGTWQLKSTTNKKYIILGTDDDNVGNTKFFRLLRTYGFPYTMNTEAENVISLKALGSDTDDAIFNSEDAPALFPNGVDIVTLGKYLHDNNLGEVAQHGSSGKSLWDSGKLTGEFLTSLHTSYVKQGGTKTEAELKAAIMEQLSDTDGVQGASYVNDSRDLLEQAYGFPIVTVGIWGGAPAAVIDGIKCDLNTIKGTSNYDWRANNYLSVGTVLGRYKGNNSTYDISRVVCNVEEVAAYIEQIECGKVCEFFWHMPFQDEPDIDKWRTLFNYIKSLVDSGEAEVVTRKQYAALGEWVNNPIINISINRANIPLGENDYDGAYTITATYADNSTANVSDEAIIDRSAVDTNRSGVYTVSASYRGFNTTTTLSVISTGYTIPDGLKDVPYWFVAKNETQNILFAGNTTGTFGKAGVSSSVLTFFDCANGKLNGWISTDNGATWNQVNKDEPHYKNIKTNTIGSNSGFSFGCASGDCITWLETSNNFTVASTPSEEPIASSTDEKTEKILSNENNYVYGYYKHWGGEFAESSDAVCATEFVPVTENVYYFYTNDPRVVVTIQQYDKDKKWIEPKEEYRKLQRGTKITLEDNTEYLSITLRSSVWGVDVMELLECGLAVEFVNTEPDFTVNTISVLPDDWTDLSRWHRGTYSESAGELMLGNTGMSFDSYLQIESERYLVSLPDNNLELHIIELTRDNQVLRVKKLGSSELWIPLEEAGKAAITLVGKSKDITVQQLENALKQFDFELLGYYQDEEYNKVMQTLTASEFVNRMNVGWNLGNSLDCKAKTRGLDANVKQELLWFNPYVEKSLIDYVAKLGFNTIRIPVTWYYNTEIDKEGNLIIGEEFLARVKQVVNYAIENNLYVILNSHHDEEMIYAGVNDSEMEQVYKDAEALWRQIANYFKDYDEHLIFEAYNEVDNRELNWTFGEKAAIQANRLNQIFVDTVRSTGGNNQNRILMVPTLIDKYNEQMLKAFVVPEDTAKDRLIVQVHAYSKVFSQMIENDFMLLEKYSDQWGVPIVIGEFGTTNKYFEPSLRAIHAANYIARASEHGIKCIWWDNGGDFGIINRTDYSKSDMEIINALFSGLDGMKCKLDDEIILDQPEQYVDGSVQDNEIVVNRYWGAIATDNDGDAIAIPKGSKCMLSLTAQGETSEVWLGSVAFFDKNREVVAVTTNDISETTTPIKALFWTCDVPKEACYIRVSMYSPFTNISRDVFDQSLNDGKLKLSVSIFDLEEVKLSK